MGALTWSTNANVLPHAPSLVYFLTLIRGTLMPSQFALSILRVFQILSNIL